MRKYMLYCEWVDAPMTLLRASRLFGLGSDAELDALAGLGVGDKHVDADGDTWERVE